MFNFFLFFQITWEFFTIVECWVWPSPVCSLTWILYSHLDFLLLVKSIIKPCCVRITYLAWWTEREREPHLQSTSSGSLILFCSTPSTYNLHYHELTHIISNYKPPFSDSRCWHAFFVQTSIRAYFALIISYISITWSQFRHWSPTIQAARSFFPHEIWLNPGYPSTERKKNPTPPGFEPESSGAKKSMLPTWQRLGNRYSKN